MSSQKRRVRWSLLAIAAFLVYPVSAAGVDCSRTHDPVARTICANPKISALDSQLSVAYAAALVRDSSHANDLKLDEINWLGERNQEMWGLLASQREFPLLPNGLEATLAKFYQLRIAFLHDIDNAAVTRGMPIAQRVLHAAATLPARATDPLKALEAAGLVVLPEEAQSASSPERAIATLAAPPDAALQAALDRFRPYPGTVVYLPSVGLGGAFYIEGTAYCQYWVVFEKQGNATVPVSGPAGGLLGGCIRDGGSTGYLALIHGHPVALDVTNDTSFPNITDFQWQRWLGGSTWGPARRIRFRYDYSLKSSSENFCSKTSPACTLIEGVALGTAQRYMRDALALANPAGETGAKKARFRQLLQRAPHRKEWGYCWYPLWFSTRLKGKLTIGGITQSHIGCHPVSSLDVAFWGTRNHGTQWWHADSTIDVDRGKLLLAALMPPFNRPNSP